MDVTFVRQEITEKYHPRVPVDNLSNRGIAEESKDIASIDNCGCKLV
jgi:hypothetical protein